MLVLFLSYQAGFSLFTHTHIIDGVKIVHSHPYAGDNHVHTDAQIFAISHISAFVGEEARSFDAICAVFEIVSKIGIETVCVKYLSANVDNLTLRAPPSCC